MPELRKCHENKTNTISYIIVRAYLAANTDVSTELRHKPYDNNESLKAIAKVTVYA